LEAIIKSSENFPGGFEANQILTHLSGKTRKENFEKFENFYPSKLENQPFFCK